MFFHKLTFTQTLIFTYISNVLFSSPPPSAELTSFTPSLSQSWLSPCLINLKISRHPCLLIQILGMSLFEFYISDSNFWYPWTDTNSIQILHVSVLIWVSQSQNLHRSLIELSISNNSVSKFYKCIYFSPSNLT